MANTDGADLMLPGVDPGALPQLPAGRVVCICVPGNPAPFAVSGRDESSTSLVDTTACMAHSP